MQKICHGSEIVVLCWHGPKCRLVMGWCWCTKKPLEAQMPARLSSNSFLFQWFFFNWKENSSADLSFIFHMQTVSSVFSHCHCSSVCVAEMSSWHGWKAFQICAASRWWEPCLACILARWPSLSYHSFWYQVMAWERGKWRRQRWRGSKAGVVECFPCAQTSVLSWRWARTYV